MKPRTCFVAVYVALALVAPAHAQIDCAAWNTKSFFLAAEVSDVTRCLQAGADLEARGAGGHTPLHTAALGGTAEAVMALLKAGADPKVRNNSDELPFDYARDNEKLQGTDAYWELYQAQFD